MPFSLETLATGLHELSSQEVSSYQEKGHLCLRHVCSNAEVEAVRGAIGEAVDQIRAQRTDWDKPMAERDTYARAFIQAENIWRLSDAVAKFSLGRRFGKIAADLMKVDRVRIYHDQALYKEPGGGYTPWHQDQTYWPLENTQAVTMWMPLRDCGAEAGALVFADGSHATGPLRSLFISDASEDYFKDYARENSLHLSINELKVGDATFHNGWTLHKAPGNAGKTMREVMTIIFFADGARVTEPKEGQDAVDRFLGGRQPGEAADSPELNPLVFDRSTQ